MKRVAHAFVLSLIASGLIGWIYWDRMRHSAYRSDLSEAANIGIVFFWIIFPLCYTLIHAVRGPFTPSRGPGRR